MKLIHPYTHQHAGFIERLHRTLHKLIWSQISEKGSHLYIDKLDRILHSYNNRPHRMLGGKSPQFAEDNPTNAYIATKNMEYLNDKKFKRKKPRYKVGMKVRVKKNKYSFMHGYDENFNEEVTFFSISFTPKKKSHQKNVIFFQIFYRYI